MAIMQSRNRARRNSTNSCLEVKRYSSDHLDFAAEACIIGFYRIRVIEFKAKKLSCSATLPARARTSSAAPSDPRCRLEWLGPCA